MVWTMNLVQLYCVQYHVTSSGAGGLSRVCQT